MEILVVLVIVTLLHLAARKGWLDEFDFDECD